MLNFRHQDIQTISKLHYSQVTNNKLSHQNLKKHDMKNNMTADGKVDHYVAAAIHPPPATQQGIGKYRGA